MLWPAGRVGSGWTAPAPRRRRSAYTGRRRPLALRVRRRSPSLHQVPRLGPGRYSDVWERQRRDGSGDRIPHQMFLADRPSTRRHPRCGGVILARAAQAQSRDGRRRPDADAAPGPALEGLASSKPCTEREFLLSETPGSCSYSYAAVTILVHTTKLK